jgi:chemotaxis response regulator CheB
VNSDIDNVMKIFAKNYHSRCIGVILTGCEATTGTYADGSNGVKHIKRHRGRVLVQIEETDTGGRYELGHYYNGMPRFAQKAVKCDFAGSLPDLVKELNSYLN